MTTGNKPSILIVDSNPGFANMLKQSLEQDAEYDATVAPAGTEALALARKRSFDLAIVDLGIDATGGLDGEAVARKLREGRASLRLVLIPLEGEALPERLADVDVQGTLPKPFFLPDLPELMAAALAKPLLRGEEISRPVQPSEPQTRPSRQHAWPVIDVSSRDTASESSRSAVRELEALSREVNAVAVLTIRGGQVVHSVGRLSAEDLERLARIVYQSCRISGQAAEALGREQWQFEQSVETDEYTVYTLTVASDLLLSTVLHANVPLGFLRHQARGTATRLRDLVDSS